MAKTDYRMPPDIIQAIEKVANNEGEVRVRIANGSWKVQEIYVRLVTAQDI